jgi:hypothetical protein
MAYIGRQNLGGAYRQLDDISSGFDGSDTTHTMQVNSQNVTVGDVNQIILSLGGVIQKPGTDFTVSGSVLTFTTAPAANTSFFAMLLGSDNGGTVTPTDGSVTTGKIVDDAITAAKVASSGAFAIGAAGTASSLAGIPFFQGDTGSIYTHDVSGTDSTAQYNTAYGLTAMDAITTGDQNTSIGYGAGGANQTGAEQVNIGYQAGLVCTSSGNVLIGKDAGLSITSGEANIHIGVRAGDGYDTETNNVSIGVDSLGGSVAGGEYNTAVGNFTLDALTSGDANVAVGFRAGSAITTGTSNVIIGKDAAQSTTEGDNSVFVGENAGNAITTGHSVVFIGKSAGDGHDTETHNLAIGRDALGGSSLAGAEYNVAIGNYALDALTSGDYNNAIGYEALSQTTTGGYNVALGRLAGDGVTDENFSCYIGHGTGGSYTGSESIMLGALARHHQDGNNESNAICIGYNITSGRGNQVHLGNTSVTAIKGQVSFSTYSDERIKRDIVDTDLGLEFVNKLKPRKFKRKNPEEYADLFGEGNKTPIKDDEKENVFDGLIAQEVEAVCNELGVSFSGHEVSTSQGNKQSIQYETLVVPLIKAVQELSAKVKALEEA